MKIDEVLKNNLIADVENIVSTELRPQTKAALKRCFEITIGHHYARLTAINAKQGELRKQLIVSKDQIKYNLSLLKKDGFGYLTYLQNIEILIIDIESELASLNDPESDIPKHPTSWRDFTMTDDVEPQGSRQTAEEILKDELSEYYWEIITKQDDEGHTTFKDWIIEAMERYAQSQQPEISDEEKQGAEDKIMELLNKYSTTSIDWLSVFYPGYPNLIDPMDYHKIAQEYAQSQQPEVNVTDEMIEAEFERTHPAIDEYEKMIAVNLAKAVRDNKLQSKQVK